MRLSFSIRQHNIVRVAEAGSVDPDNLTRSGQARLETGKDRRRGGRTDLHREAGTAMALDFHDYLTRSRLKLFGYDDIMFLRAML